MKESMKTKDLIIVNMRNGMTFRDACKSAGVHRVTGWRWQKRDAHFRRSVFFAQAEKKLRRWAVEIDRLEKQFCFLNQE